MHPFSQQRSYPYHQQQEDASSHEDIIIPFGGSRGIDHGGGSSGTTTTTSTAANIEKEHMFDKVVTPSDVGKLNRLVIPKQHAEKYFPLDSSTNDKGLLLNFEDSNGKPWRFRYSYWNSSQSYVMTKGWSRFVKEKKLDAGDIVSFQRGVGDSAKDRLFIDWRRRPDSLHHHHHLLPPPLIHSTPAAAAFSMGHWNPLLVQPPRHVHPYAPALSVGSLIYLRSGGGGGGGGGGSGPATAPVPVPIRGLQREEGMVFDSVPVVQGKASAKRLRLFGVNMECGVSDESPSGSGESPIYSHKGKTSTSLDLDLDLDLELDI